MISYYAQAAWRSWDGAWNWATGQGLFLEGLVAFALFICAVLLAYWKRHSWRGAKVEILSARKVFTLAAIVAPAIALLLTFFVFFLRDAPEQARIADASIGKLTSDISALQSQLAERENRRNIRIALGRFALEGSELLATMATAPPDAAEAAAEAWEARIKQFMITDMDESYYDRLADTSSIASRPLFNKNPALSFSIWNMTSNLQKILTEYD
jgi:hypothetical protein